MTKQTDFQNWLDELRQTTDYRAAHAALDFIVECEIRRDELGLSYADVAKKLNVSRARINQLFRGETNMTLLTMQKLADALELTLVISASPLKNKKTKGSASKTPKTPAGKTRAKKPAKSSV